MENNTDVSAPDGQPAAEPAAEQLEPKTPAPDNAGTQSLDPESEEFKAVADKYALSNMKHTDEGLVSSQDGTKQAGYLYSADNPSETIGSFEATLSSDGTHKHEQLDTAYISEGDIEYEINYAEDGHVTNITKTDKSAANLESNNSQPPAVDAAAPSDSSNDESSPNKPATDDKPAEKPTTAVEQPAVAVEYKPVKGSKTMNEAAKTSLDAMRRYGTGVSEIQGFEYSSEDREQVVDLSAKAMMTANSKLSEEDARKYSEKMFDEAQKRDVNYATVFGIMEQESNFNTEATSGTGAGGLMQLTGVAIKDQSQLKNDAASEMLNDRSKRYDPMLNIEVGVAALDTLQDRYLKSRDKDPKMYSLEGQIGSYNAGSGGMNSYIKTGNWSSGQKEYTMMVKQRRNAFNEYMNANMGRNNQ